MAVLILDFLILAMDVELGPLVLAYLALGVDDILSSCRNGRCYGPHRFP